MAASWDEIRSALDHIPAECSREEWLTVGMALHHQFGGDYEALELWDRWSDNDGACGSYAAGQCAAKWDSFGGTGGTTLRSLVFKVNKVKTVFKVYLVSKVALAQLVIQEFRDRKVLKETLELLAHKEFKV